ncbi:SWIM zinc finger [Paenibacillus algorifonticola]|uniref:SWIM zinc finger n=1 Tax=Paenibacillus algorifonticola TaxID=684063 RepID=A0A1I2B8C5_9BACL|nr:SWIM zinc finger family protein [Paenibacillus algorifonticola]SFE52326.1 SWIM zinc finger [Paenibacillus algorifonticola]
MAFYNGFPEYVSVAERKRRAAAAAEKLQQKNAKVWPVVITGRTVAATWWGKAWCANLESYADYSNRIDRGRSYVRHGAVLDLQMAGGKVEALVQGSSTKPYKVEITVGPLPGSVWKQIVKECAGKISSLQELVGGKFPAGLSELFTTKGTGLFPSPKDIHFRCSCPDYAVMCKHVAAVLYGIGARFDHDSALFFQLRNVKMDELISASLAAQSQEMLGKGGRRSRRVVDDGDLGSKFGIELDMGAEEGTSAAKGIGKQADRNMAATGRSIGGAKTDTETSASKAEPTAGSEGTKPRRGRPPKNKAVAEAVQVATDAVPSKSRRRL